MSEPSTIVWPSEPSAYELLHELGGDGYSSLVYEALCKSKQCNVAVKTITADEDVQLGAIQADLERVKTQRHPNLVDHYTFFITPDNDLWIVMKLMDRGSVADIIRHKERERMEDGSTDCVLAEEFTSTVLKYTLEGLRYLHEHNSVHRALKAANILVSSAGEVMISDGGVTWQNKNESADGEEQVCQTFVGDPFWMAPEVIEQRGYNEKADIWSLGITALEMATGAAPYTHMEPMKAMMLIMENSPPSLESIAEERGRAFTSYSSDFNDFVEACLTRDPESRPSAEEMLAHPFIKRLAKDSAYLRVELESVPNISQLRSTQASLMRHSSIASKKRGASKKRSGRYVARGGQWEAMEGRRRLSEINSRLKEEPAVPDRTSTTVHIADPNNNGNNIRRHSSVTSPTRGLDSVSATATSTTPPAATPLDIHPPALPVVSETSTTTTATAPTTANSNANANEVHAFRMRMFHGGACKELSFSITVPPESPEQISEELVNDQFLRALDCATVASTMRKLMAGPERAITFRLYGTPLEEAIPVELKDGFMQIIYDKP